MKCTCNHENKLNAKHGRLFIRSSHTHECTSRAANATAVRIDRLLHGNAAKDAAPDEYTKFGNKRLVKAAHGPAVRRSERRHDGEAGAAAIATARAPRRREQRVDEHGERRRHARAASRVGQ